MPRLAQITATAWLIILTAIRAIRLGHGLAEEEAIRDIVIEDNEFIDRSGTASLVPDHPTGSYASARLQW